MSDMCPEFRPEHQKLPTQTRCSSSESGATCAATLAVRSSTQRSQSARELQDGSSIYPAQLDIVRLS
eukprot:4591571-Amphidinium_carterae.1